jgi:hypothetical protein
MKKLRNTLTTITLLTLIAMFAASAANGQTIVNRARIGGYAEDITFVTSGPLKGQLVMMNGYELHSVEMDKKGVLNRVCKLESPEFDQFVNGFTFVASEGLFAMNNAPHPDKLFFFDQACGFKGTRPIQYLDSNYRPAHIEGLAYIPADAPVFPDHLIMAVWDALGAGDVRLEIMRRDGVVVAEIHRPDWPTQLLADGGLGDVMYLGPNRLLLSAYSVDSLWIVDFSGNIVSGPLATGADGMGEGIVRLDDGRVAATNYPQSLLVFDKDLNRQPQDDRHDVIGVNLNVPNGIAWDADANRFLVTHDTNLVLNGGISGLSTTLNGATPVVNLNSPPFSRQTIYLPQDDLVGVLRFGGSGDRAIVLFNTDGTLNSQISLSPTSLGQNFGQPLALAYLPGTDEFVVGFGGVPGPGQALERLRLRVISRTGTLVRTIDLAGTGTAGVNGVEYFEDPQGGGGRLLLIAAFGRMIVTDLDGNPRDANSFTFGEFNVRVKLGLITRNDVAAITSGPLAGAFAILDANGGEVVIFRLN